MYVTYFVTFCYDPRDGHYVEAGIKYLPPSQILVYYAALFHHPISGFRHMFTYIVSAIYLFHM